MFDKVTFSIKRVIPDPKWKAKRKPEHLIRWLHKRAFHDEIIEPYNVMCAKVGEITDFYRRDVSKEVLLKTNEMIKRDSHVLYTVFSYLIISLMPYTKSMKYVIGIMGKFAILLRAIAAKRDLATRADELTKIECAEMIDHILVNLVNVFANHGVQLEYIFDGYGLESKNASIGIKITHTQIGKMLAEGKLSSLFKMTPKNYKEADRIKKMYSRIVTYLRNITKFTQDYINRAVGETPYAVFARTRKDFYCILSDFFDQVSLCDPQLKKVVKTRRMVKNVKDGLRDFAIMMICAREQQKIDTDPEGMLTIFFEKLVKTLERYSVDIHELFDDLGLSSVDGETMNLKDIGEAIDRVQVDGFFRGIDSYLVLK